VKEKRKKQNPSHLWERYRDEGDSKARNALVERYLHIVRFVAERIFNKLPSSVDFDDLTSAGIFGLFNAIDGYDFERGTKFETYCAARVRGAILDELRSQDWVPRLIRARANRIQATYEELEAKLQRDPTKEEMAACLDVSVADYEQMLQDSSAATLVSLNKRVDDGEGPTGSTQADILEDKRGPSPYEHLQMKDVIRLIHKNLSKQERLIVLLYYYEELTMKEIGAALDLSESRVCQILSKVTTRLKGKFRNMRNELLS
jgi:RNA polymerase sigma factor for flagellar operon FliA